jgi:polysaccharide export outer membrane protein
MRVNSLTFALSIVLGLGLATTRGLADSSSTYQVGPGDVLQVVFYAGAEKQEVFSGTVSAIGTLTSPLLGEIRAGGLTIHEISRMMTELLARDFFVNPQVLVNVKEYGGQVWVVGAVKSPGPYPYSEGLSALRACLLAGGFTDFASLRKVKVARVTAGRSRVTRVDLAKVMQGKVDDPPLQRSDRIEVPQRRF